MSLCLQITLKELNTGEPGWLGWLYLGLLTGLNSGSQSPKKQGPPPSHPPLPPPQRGYTLSRGSAWDARSPSPSAPASARAPSLSLSEISQSIFKNF